MKMTTKLAASAGLILCCAGMGPLTAAAEEALSSNVLYQISVLNAEKYSRTPAQLKLDSQLVYAIKQAGGQPVAPGLPLLQLAVTPTNGNVLVDCTAQVSPGLLSAIAQMGGSVKYSNSNYNAIRALVPVNQLEILAGRSDVRFVQGAVGFATCTGSVDSEGDTTHAANTARARYGVTGAGVKVGVLSDSVDYLSQAQSTGDLPTNLVVLPGQSGVPGSGEGTAMLEIVNDLAPGAGLYFATAVNGAANFAQNIRDLRSAGCDIIVDDVFYFNESPFQDGIIAKAVNQVTASGALYFSSAGNEGSITHGTSGTWEGDFVDGGPAGSPVNGKQGRIHNFGNNGYNSVTGTGFGVTTLFWADPLGAATNDYDLYVVDAAGTTLVSSSTTVQNGSQDPYEIVFGASTGRRVVVVQASGAGRFLHVNNIRGTLGTVTLGTIKGHCASTNAFAVAAVDASTSYPNPFTGAGLNPVEFFSTDGPRRVFFDENGNAITPGDFSSTGGFVRSKPDIAAADGVATTLPPFSGLNPFFGTSAAAPHAGAVAALLKSYNPTLDLAGVSNIFARTALDIEGTGFDVNAGSGIVMADRSIAAAPQGINLVIVTNYLTGGNGNGLIDANECNDLSLVVQNFGSAGATNIQIIVTTTNAGVLIAQRVATLPDLPSNAAATNSPSFKISTTPDFQCGSTVFLTVGIKADEGTTTNILALASGTNGIALRYDNNTAVPIPDANPAGAVSSVVVTNVTTPISHVQVSAYVPHTFDSDLNFELIGPDGTRVQLSNNNGGAGNNYGTSCSDSSRTIWDDDASTPISSGVAPFIGIFKPETPLSVFLGKSGTNINGTWVFHAVDSVGIDVGSIECWSLLLTPAICADGGGQCPGVDLAIGMVPAPEPVVQGSNLTYTITVTNFGPNTAKSTVMNQILPSGVVFVSGTVSQGSVSQSGGIVTASFGNISVNGVAIAVITVTPVSTGVLTSSATVSAADTELDPSNNTITVASHVNPPLSDLAVGISALPNPVLVGQNLTYTVSVTNRGPAIATGVTVTNVIPLAMGIASAIPSQGVVTSTSGNIVVASFGTITNGGRATLTVSVIPSQQGTFTATANAAAIQQDPFIANNSAAVSTVVGPAADLALTLTQRAANLVVNTTNTYTLSVVNRGPSPATSVILQDIMPATGVLVTPGYSVVSNIVSIPLGSLNPGAATNILLDVRFPVITNVINAASVSADQTDPNSANNTASLTTIISAPTLTFAADGAVLVAENFSPTNGTVDVGETVTVNLAIKNTGNIFNSNLVATLLATNGVTSPSGAQTYFAIAPGDFRALPFTFTAAGTNGGVVVATLRLQDASTNFATTNITYTFFLPAITSFANTNRIDIPTTAQDQQQPGPAAPYPSTISVSGLTGLVSKVTVTVSNLTHTFAHDLNLLLVAPSGAKTLLMSHVSDGSVNDATLTFDDNAPAPLPDSGGIGSGAWQPAAYVPAAVFSNPAPSGPYSGTLKAQNGPAPNGIWSLYATDDSAGDFGAIAGGWSLSFASITPVNKIADLSIAPFSVPTPNLVGSSLGNIFVIHNTGPNDAAEVTFTSVLPAGATFNGATNSGNAGQNFSYSGGVVTAKLGNIPSGSTTFITISFTPNSSGTISNYASVVAASGETDLNPDNNSGSAISQAIPPTADLGLRAAVSPTSVILRSNVTFTLAWTNNGPQYALTPAITNPIPAGFNVVSPGGSAPVGFQILGGNLVAFLPTIASGATGAVSFILSPTNAGTFTNTATIYTTSSDPQSTNNAAVSVITAVAPAPMISAAGARIIGETQQPANGAVDVAETVTVSLLLTNSGQLDATNLTATLLSGNGVSSPSAPVLYGLVPHGGTNVPGVFSFTASATSNGIIYAVLQLTDGTNNLGTTAFAFVVTSTNTFANAGAITIPDHGAAVPYPASITISGVTGVISHAAVTIKGITHAFPDDLDIMLVSPAGQKIVLMSDAGGGHSVNNVDLTFDDNASAQLSDTAQIVTGTYQPTDFETGDVFPSPAPGGARSAALSSVNGLAPNGTWNLFVFDDSVGDGGSIAGGWTLNLTVVNPVNPVLNLVVTLTATPNPVYTDSTLTYGITVTNRGPITASNVVVQDVLPAGFALSTNYTGSGSSFVGSGTVSFTIPTLAAGSGFGALIQGSFAAAGLATNSVSVSSSEVDLEPASNFAQTTTTVVAPLAPRLVLTPFTASQFELKVTAEPLQVYRVEQSANLVNWSTTTTTTNAASGTFKIGITNSSPSTLRYYRAARIP